MKKLLVLPCLFVALCSNSFGQDVSSIRESARLQLQQGNYDNAIQLLESARLLQPDNIEVLKDQALAYYYKRDFAKAMETGKKLIEQPNPDVQSYQLLGMAYKAVAKYKDGEKLYKTALQKFPKSGVLYSEYGDLLMSDNNKSEAIQAWEKGIRGRPQHQQ